MLGGVLLIIDNYVHLPEFQGPEAGTPEAAQATQARNTMRETGLAGFSANGFGDAVNGDPKTSRALLAMLGRERRP